jgi:hypothetical protein
MLVDLYTLRSPFDLMVNAGHYEKWLPILHTLRTERMKDIRALAIMLPNGLGTSFDQAA